VLRYDAGRFHLQRAVLVGETGLQSHFSCTALTLRLLHAIDGQRTVAEVLDVAVPTEARDSAMDLLREAAAFGALKVAG
jgi:hypothetical protein